METKACCGSNLKLNILSPICLPAVGDPNYGNDKPIVFY